jgi:ribosomal-protein-alanine N-acetyltransferase
MNVTKRNAIAQVRRMRLEDIDAVHAIDVNAFSTPWPRRAYVHEITDNIASHVWVAVIPMEHEEEKVVGMIALWLIIDEVHIGTLAVHSDHRRKGIATRLLETGLRFAAENGATTATLEVRRSNTPAQALYRQFGFDLVGRRKAYYHDNKEDALVMATKNLSQALLYRKENSRAADSSEERCASQRTIQEVQRES